MKSDRPVKWDVWREVPQVQAWQAVALSLGIEPQKVRFGRDGWMAGDAYFEESESFTVRFPSYRRKVDTQI